MKRNLIKFFKKKKFSLITISDIKEIFKYTKSNDIIKLYVNEHIIIIKYKHVTIKPINGEWEHIILTRNKDRSVSELHPDMKSHVLKVIKNWYDDLEKLYLNNFKDKKG